MPANPPHPLLDRVGQVGIMVKDLESATAFYRDKLGMKHLFSAPGMAFFDLGGMRLMLGQAGGEYPPCTYLYYKVDDIEAAAKALQARGVKMMEAPELAHRMPGMELWLALFEDMDRNIVALMCEKRTAE
ncbi:MAG TPA: VOC family protein [Gammaproteobacteria bacterium]|nr:VOC family protein [Gammaproteobacteria bacterium]